MIVTASSKTTPHGLLKIFSMNDMTKTHLMAQSLRIHVRLQVVFYIKAMYRVMAQQVDGLMGIITTLSEKADL